jgi:hypothetical protein
MLVATNSVSYLKKPKQFNNESVYNNYTPDLLNEVGIIYPWKNNSSIFIIEIKRNAKSIFTLLENYQLYPTFMFKNFNEKEKSRNKSKINNFTLGFILSEPINDIEMYKSILSKIQQILKFKKPQFNTHYFTGARNLKNKIFHKGEVLNTKKFIDQISFIDLNIANPIKYPYTLFNKYIVDINKLYNKCYIYRDLTNNLKVKNYDKLLLISNLYKYDNGYVLSDHLDDSYMNHISKLQRNPIKNYKCSNCSKYNKCDNGKKFNSIINLINNNEESSDIDKYISLEEGRDLLDNMIKINLESNDTNKVYIYNVQAGLGKSHSIINNYRDKGVLAFPSHKLKNEHIKSLNKIDIYPVATKDINEIVTKPSDQKLISKLYTTSNTFMINDIIKGYPGGEEYLKNNGSKLKNGTFTTHHKLNNNVLHKEVTNIFYDEDPSQSCKFTFKNYNYIKVLKDLIILKDKNIITKLNYDKVLDHLNLISTYELPIQINSKILTTIKNKILNYQIKNRLLLSSNIIEFLSSTIFSSKSYSKVVPFTKDINIHIFSATPDIPMIKHLAELSNKTVEIKTIYNVKRIGKIEQHLQNTTRSALNKNKLKVKDDRATITFKNQTDNYNEDESVPYGGNSFGYNNWIGKDINIAYTFQLIPEYYYHKYTLLFNKQLTDKDINMTIRNVTWSNHTFKYYSYKNVDLRELVFNNINSEMIQAVERSRTISEDCVSTIYSKFICSIVNGIHIIKKENH